MRILGKLESVVQVLTVIMVREVFTTGDPGRGEGPVVVTWPEMRKTPAKPQEDLLPDPREDGGGHRMQL